MTFYCTACWSHIVLAQYMPAPHHHREGCFERHRVFGEKLAQELVDRGPHECRWKDCQQGGVYRA